MPNAPNVARLREPQGWLRLTQAVATLDTLPPSTASARALRPLLREADALRTGVVGQDQAADADARAAADAAAIAETFADASPEVQRSVLARAQDYGARLLSAVRTRIRSVRDQLRRAGRAVQAVPGSVLAKLEFAEVLLVEWMRQVGRGAMTAAAGGLGLGLLLVGALFLLTKGR